MLLHFLFLKKLYKTYKINYKSIISINILTAL